MKLHLQAAGGQNTVTAYGPGYVEINERRYEHGLMVTPRQVHPNWAGGGFGALSLADFEALRDLHADIVLVGTGERQQFPAAALLRPLIEARIGFEIMDTRAASRTYNILVSEGRNVVAALIVS